MMASAMPRYRRQVIRRNRRRPGPRTDASYIERAGWLHRESHRVGRLLASGKLDERARDFLDKVVFKETISFANQRAAFHYLEAFGGKAPGPDGIRYKSLSHQQWWHRMNENVQLCEGGVYPWGPMRSVEIPKGLGTRTLHLENTRDRVVGRSVLTVVSPLTDVGFSEMSYGYRPGRSPWDALAMAKVVAEEENKLIWRKRDITGAYDNVPRQALIDLVYERIPNRDLARLIVSAIERAGTEWAGKGVSIPQGTSLSPWLLNLFLDAVVDKPYEREGFPCVMQRFADDHLLLANRPDDAAEALAFMDGALGRHDMKFKADKDDDGDLALGEAVNYLGLEAYWEKGEIYYDVPEDTWLNFKTETHEGFDPSWSKKRRRKEARKALAEWMQYFAPTEGRLRNGKNLLYEALEIITPNFRVDLFDERGTMHAFLDERIGEWRERVRSLRATYAKSRLASPTHISKPCSANAALASL